MVYEKDMKKMAVFPSKKAFAKLLAAIFFCLCGGASLNANSLPPLAEVIARMQLAADNAKTITASFSQEVLMQATNIKKKERGLFFFKKPLQMRWAYQEPLPKLLILGEKIAWFYLPEKETAYRQSTASLLPSQTTMRLLAGNIDINRDFRVELLGEDGSAYRLRLQPLAKDLHINAQEITLLVDKESFLIVGCSFDDLYGNRNILVFEELRVNEELADSLFIFTPPAHVQVIEI